MSDAANAEPSAPPVLAQMSGRRASLVAAKALFAFLGFSALVTEVATLVAEHRFNGADFFSYFTVESNAPRSSA